MDRQKILEKLAAYYGLILEYTDKEGKPQKASSKECQEYLDIIGIKTENIEDLAEELKKTELKKWSKIVSPLQVVTKGEVPVITLHLPDTELNKSFEWELIEEEGRFHHGEFYASHLQISDSIIIDDKTFYKIDLPLPILVGIGYHNLKVKSENGKETFMKLIIVPKESYKPLAIQRQQQIKGFKFSLFDNNPYSDCRTSNYVNLRDAVSYAAKEKLDVVGIDKINEFHFCNDTTNPEIPSSRLMYNTALINVDEAINFVEDKEIKLKLLSEELQEELKEIQEQEKIDHKSIYNIKIKYLKIIYNSFRENHIKNNTYKSQDFFQYISSKNGHLRKLALFEAIKEYLISEDPKLSNWQEWPEDYQNPSSEAVLLFEDKNIEALQFYEFLQWIADLQLSLAGKTSWINKLAIGIYSEWPFYVSSDSAEAWLRQYHYAFDASITCNLETQEALTFAPLIPYKIKNKGYKYISEMFINNMTHSGALRIKNIQEFEKQHWTSTENPDVDFYVEYPLKDILGIIALESHRNKCLVLIDKTEHLSQETLNLLDKYEFLQGTDFDINEITEENSTEFFETVNQIQQQQIEGKEYKDRISLERTPSSLYRLQFNKTFTFKDAQAIVPYLKDLGISHCYASPLLRAREGSMHGYDIIDHSQLNPEIGSLEDFNEFVNTLHHYDMGLIIDIVPNHMGVGCESKWWMDVLENGRASAYASFFDIDWEPLKKELEGKVLVPILGDHYGNILESGQFKFTFDKETGKLKLNYWEHALPINPSSYPLFLEHRLDVLQSRLGSNNPDFLEYSSILTEFKKIPGINETSSEKVTERNREKEIASRRLASLCRNNPTLEGFIEENIIDFQCKSNDPVSCNRIHSLLEEQAYRLAYWRVSVDIINYRRFFDVNDLIGLKTENPLVFSSTHGFILDLIEQNKIDGLRIDHPDGLLDPTEYFKKLQVEAGKRLGTNFDQAEEKPLGSDNLPIYVAAEKILAPFEKIPKNWAISGTTGYEFLNLVSNLFINDKNSKKFTRIYERFIGKTQDFEELVIECKKLIMKTSLTGELSTLSNHINKISEKYYSTRDFTLNSLRDALTEIIACFPTYRTYISQENKGDKAIDYIKWAIGRAKKQTMHTDPSIFDFIEKVLLTELEEDKESLEYAEILNFAMKFQQYTAPLMAKGLEDTSFYRYNRLIALNEVGGEPAHFGVSTNEFHNENIKRFERTPHCLITTSTHDTKRSEDVRARLCVLSEIPEKWQEKINKWSRLNKSKKTKIDNMLTPSRNDEYLFYQTLVGIWPNETPDENQRQELIQRINEYMIKALREAKKRTSWVNINDKYEESVSNFINKVLSSPENHPFWKEFLPFQKTIAHAGFINSTAQTVLKLTCPGIPDIYQGNEMFKFTLVDPDNRRPVDYKDNKHKLEQIKHLISEDKADEIKWEDKLIPFTSGIFKLFITSSILNFRQKNQKIFRKGDYIPLETEGVKTDHVVAFARYVENEAIIVVVPRFVYRMISEEVVIPVGEEAWANTKVCLSENLSEYKLKDILTGKEINITDNKKLDLKTIFNDFPVAIIHAKQS